MDVAAKKERVKEWVEKKLSTEKGYFLVDIKMPGAATMQVFVDGDQGITIDKCAEISRYIEKELDSEKLLGENYTLEVSSPGMGNPFKVFRQYQRSVGKEVSVIKKDGIRIDGVLSNVDEEKIVVETIKKLKKKETEIRVYEISFSEIKKTMLNINF